MQLLNVPSRDVDYCLTHSLHVERDNVDDKTSTSCLTNEIDRLNARRAENSNVAYYNDGEVYCVSGIADSLLQLNVGSQFFTALKGITRQQQSGYPFEMTI